MKIFFHYFLLLLVLIVFLKGGKTQAHSYGVTFERQIGTSFIDIGCYVKAFQPKQKAYCTFELLKGINALEHESFPHDAVSVEIRDKRRKSILKTIVPVAQFTTASLPLTFPEYGRYTMSVRFTKKTAVLAETIFSVHVRRNSRI